MTKRRPSRDRNEFWSDQPGWEGTRDSRRTRQHSEITRSNWIVPGLGATGSTPTAQSRIFDFENDPQYATGAHPPISASPSPSRPFVRQSSAPGGYAWPVAGAGAAGAADDDWGLDEWDDEPDPYRLGTYSRLGSGAAGAAPAIDDDPAPHEIELGEHRRRVGVDPLLMRLGVIVALAVAAVPIATSIGGGDSSAGGIDDDASSTTETTAARSGEDRQPAPRATPSAKRKAKPRRTSTTAESMEVVAAQLPSDAESAVKDKSAVAAVAAPEPEAECGVEYQVVAGDYWVRIAEGSKAPLDDLLAANSAQVETPIYAGDVICLSMSAIQQPPPPTTQAPATTEAPTTTAAPTTTDAPTTTAAPTPTEAPATAAPATAAPTTAPPPTAAPTTAPPPTAAPTTQPPLPPPTTSPAPPAPSGSPEQIIREIWPDHLEDRAVEIARRESNLQPEVYNGFCCYGLFQIYFDVNRSFLATLGITSAEQLRDARTNATAAYAMYQQSGWSPWAMTDPGG